jgi:hypothetical protein
MPLSCAGTFLETTTRTTTQKHMKSTHSFTRNRHLRFAGAVTLMSAAAAMAFVAAKTSTSTGHAKVSISRFRALHQDPFETLAGVGPSGEPESSKKIHDRHSQQAYDDRAYPRKWIEAAQQLTAANAANAIAGLAPLIPASWHGVGPNGVAADALVASESTGATAGTIYSGRATAIAVSPTCTASSCTVFLGAAGGGVWKTTNALASTPTWTQVSDGPSGIPSNAIGSIVFDPSNANTIYVGTGEPNGSSDSEAGVGLYKSTDGGTTWSLVAGSTAGTAPCASNPDLLTCPVATGRSIGAIAVDPANANHILIGTDVARHGSSSVNGGRFTPPGSALIGLYESTNGGTSFSPAVILTQDAVNPASPNGSDFFRGGCSDIELYRAGNAPGTETQVYAAFFDYGVFRRSATLESGNSTFKQIFKSAGNGTVANSLASRTEFSLAPIKTGPNNGNLRIYVGDVGSGPPNGPADFYRVDNANVTAATLVNGNNGGWTKLSNSTNGTPGFASFNYCSTQCSYDMPVFSPPGAPGTVYIGSSMQYSEIGGRSNGRAIQRSVDAGVNFTDMTIDTHGVSLHPDQHAIASTPFNPNIVFIANDGGLWRLNGSFTNVSGDCASRGLTGANLTDCTNWLSQVPTTISTMNGGLETLQYQSLSVNVNTANDIMGGTQDNGTHASNPGSFGPDTWFVTIFGDGGQSGVNVGHPNVRMHTFFNAPGLTQIDVTFRGTSPTVSSETGWNWIGDPGTLSGENVSFYIPLIADPNVDGTWFFGAQHVWRTQDNGGDQTFLETNCSEFVNGLQFTGACGDWVPLGKDLSGTSFGKDKAPGQYIVATVRAPSDTGTLWVGLRRGRVFISSNADKANGSVAFYRIDTSAQPERFVSGIAVDPLNPNHAFISYSGYNAYNPTQPGHVFEVTYDPIGHTATWTNIDGNNLGDQPITGIAYDSVTGNLYVSTDFAVLARAPNSMTWVPAASGLPPVATYGLTFDSAHRVLYAATHGRSAYRLSLGQ